MQYASCEHAIAEKTKRGTAANVHHEKNAVRCERRVSACDWVGYPMQYACLLEETRAPARVHDTMRGSRFTLSSPPAAVTENYEPKTEEWADPRHPGHAGMF